MTLRERILILLCLAFCGYWGLEYVVYSWVVQPRLEQFEYSAARQQMKKCEKAIYDQAVELQDLAEQLSKTSDLAGLLQSSVLPESIWAETDILGLAEDTGWRQGLRVAAEFSERLDKDDFLGQLKQGKMPYISASPVQFTQKGIVNSTAGPLLIGTSPCLVWGPQGSNRYTLITGRFITPKFMNDFQKRFYFNFACIPYTEKSAARLPESLKNTSDTDDDFGFEKLSEDMIQCYAVLSDRAKKPALILRAAITLDVLQESWNILYIAGFIRLAATVPAIILLTIVFQIAVVSPIVDLIKDIKAIGRGQFACRLRSEQRRDEIGILAHEFDRMLERLDATKKKLVEKSFVSGMAEMSSGLLHNARNALSPLVSGLERMSEKMTEMDSPQLRQTVSEIEQDITNPQRKEALQRFLLLNVQAQQQFMQQARTNLDELSRQVYQVEEMLNGQHSFRGAAKPLESVTLKQLVEDAVELIPAGLRSGMRIHMDAGIEQLRPVHVQRVLFLQVIENLLINAAESMQRQAPLNPRLKISARVEWIENIEMLHLKVEDNGAGIEPDMMEKLFERGVSSKPAGMTGIGLHWCANTISAMKGRIWAESKGADQGACFHIVMPVLQDKESLMVNKKGTNHESECKTQNIAG